MGDEKVALRYGNFVEGLEELKTLTLKDQWWRLKNEVFKVSFIVIILQLDHSVDV